MSTRTSANQHDDILEDVTQTMRDIRAAHDVYIAEQRAAWQRYAAAVDQAVKEDLGIDDEQDRPIDELARELLAGFHGRVDDLRVQARLGRMELDDLVAELRLVAARLAEAVHP